MPVIVARGKVPWIVAGAGVAALICPRIFSSTAVTLCVVKMLAAATVSTSIPRPSRASSSSLRYALSALSFVWPKFRSCGNVVLPIGVPSAPRTRRVTTSR
jgi:hypothetical protein